MSLLPVGSLAEEKRERAQGSSIILSANRVEYFSDAATVQARGNVRVSVGGGIIVRGDAFSMDLSLQRFLVIGHVRLHTNSGDLAGAGLASFLTFHRVYFIPLDPAADRWTFLDDDFAHPEKGRVMPGDAFFLPDLSSQHPYIVAKHAEIDPGNYVKFDPATFVFLNGSLRTPPLPPYVYNFSPNQNFGVNSLSGATYDAPYNFAGSSHSLDAVHFRYDTKRKTYFSFEHHSVFKHGYAVFSLNPATQPQKQWNLLAYDRSGLRSGITLNTQLFTNQLGLSQPRSSSGFADLQFTHALRQSSVTLDFTQQYSDLIGGVAAPNHQFVSGLAWSGFDQHLFKTGLTYRLRSGVARTHDVFGVAGTTSNDIWNSFIGASLYTPVFRGPWRSSVNLVAETKRTWLSFPNTVDWHSVQLSDSKRFSDRFILISSYLVQSVAADNLSYIVLTPNIATGLVPQPLSQNGLPVFATGPVAYARATDRSLILTGAYSASPDFQLTVTGLYNHFSPVQQPFVGGPPRYQLNADVRTRISKTLFLDLGRSYYFNWANQTFSPQFSLQITPQ